MKIKKKAYGGKTSRLKSIHKITPEMPILTNIKQMFMLVK